MIYLLFEKGADIKLTANVLIYIVWSFPLTMADTKTLVIRKMICRNFYYSFRFLISHITREKVKLTYNIIWDCRSNKIQARTKLAKSEWFISFYSYMKQHLSLLPFILPFYIFIPRSEIQPYQENMFTIYQGFLKTLLIYIIYNDRLILKHSVFTW